MIFMRTTSFINRIRGRRKVVTDNGTAPTVVIDEASKLKTSQWKIKLASLFGGFVGVIVGLVIVWIVGIFGFTYENSVGKLFSFGIILWMVAVLGIVASAMMLGNRIAGISYAKSRNISDTHDHSSTDAPSDSH
jgi:hypothetical protein